MGTVSYTNGDVICHIGILSNNASATIQVVAAPLEFAAITNSATIGFAEGNLVSSNNIAYAATYAIGDFQRLLSITNAGSGVMVTWRQSPVNFLLQRSTNLALPDLWQVPGASPFVSNGLNTYLENPSGSNAFFRLTTP
jgi:hypothetical protein